MHKRFWNFKNTKENETELEIGGIIANGEGWWDDEVGSKDFKESLKAVKGDLIVNINSPGGDVFGAADIYTALKEHKGNVTVKINALCASAATVIAMAGDKILMSPVANFMIHNPTTFAWGEKKDMESCADALEEIKQSIINAYLNKCNLSKEELEELMDKETWMNANKALEYGFIDKIMYSNTSDKESNNTTKVENKISTISNNKTNNRIYYADDLIKQIDLIC